MKKILLGLLFITIGTIVFAGCENENELKRFDFSTDVSFVQREGSEEFKIDLEKSAQITKDKHARAKEIFKDASYLEDIAVTTTSTANMLWELGIIPTAATNSNSLNSDLKAMQYELEKDVQGIDKNKVLNIGSALSPSVEALVELQPKVVLFSSAMPGSDKLLTSFKENNLNAMELGQSDYIDVIVLLDVIAELSNYENEKTNAKYKEIIQDLEMISKTVSENKEKFEDKKVAVIQIMGETIRVNDGTSVLGSAMGALGLKNIFSSQSMELSTEGMIEGDPDYIFYHAPYAMGTGETDAFETKYLDKEKGEYKVIKAVQNDATFKVESDGFSFSGSVDLNIMKIIKFLANKIYK